MPSAMQPVKQSTRAEIKALHSKGDLARRRSSFSEAETAYREALALAESSVSTLNGPFGAEHLVIGECLVKLGRLHESLNMVQASEHDYRRALAIFSQSAGDEFFDLSIGRDRMDVPQPHTPAAVPPQSGPGLRHAA